MKGITMKLKKKQRKLISAFLKDIDVTPTTIFKLKDGEIEVIEKGKNKSYDVKTKYGFLYVMYNNAKAKYNYPNYDNRQRFIEAWIKDKYFGYMFAEYQMSGFKLGLKPIVIVKDPEAKLRFKNTKMVLREHSGNVNASKPIVALSTQGNGKAVKKYSSISECIRESKVSEYLIRKALNNGTGFFRLWEEGDDKDITEHEIEFERMKKELDSSLGVRKDK